MIKSSQVAGAFSTRIYQKKGFYRQQAKPTMQIIRSHYSNISGNHELVFRSLCGLLAENPQQADWSGFTPEEWELFFRIARDEGVAALVYYVLQNKPEAYHLAAFNPQTLQDLAEEEALLAVRNAVLFRQLNRVLEELTRQGITVVLLKGADLAYSLYPEPGLRAMSDLDLLVTQPDFQRALTILNTNGYHEYLPEATRGLDKLLSHHAHLKKHGSTGPLLELHWTLLGSPAFRHAAPMDWFWDRLEPCREWDSRLPEQAQNMVFRLNPTANLLYLAAHQMLQHGGDKVSLRWILDIHRLIILKGNAIDWQDLASQAGIFGWSKALLLALEAVRSCFDTLLPEGFIYTLQAQASPYDKLVELKTEPSPTRILGEWKKLRSLGWQGRIRLFIALLFPGREYMKWRYQPQPAWIWPIYYIYRWFDIVVDGFRTIFTVLRSPSKFV